MNTTGPLIGAGLVVVGGKWAGGKGLDVKAGMGAAFLVVAFSFLPDEVGGPLAWLILFAALAIYGVPFTKVFGKGK